MLFSLKNEQERLSEMEIKIRIIETLKLKMDTMNASVNQLVVNMNETQEMQLFTERTLPLLVHFQLCEGLSSVASTIQM